jgi:hypothetical protein
VADPRHDDVFRDARFDKVAHPPVTESVHPALRESQLPKQRMQMPTKYRRVPHRVMPLILYQQTGPTITVNAGAKIDRITP